MPEGLFSPIHLIILFAILLLLFGAKKLPDLGKGIGSGIREFKTGISGLNDEPVDKQLPAADSAPAPQTTVQTTAPAPQTVVQEAAPAPQAVVQEAAPAPQATVQTTVQATAQGDAQAPSTVAEAPTTTE
jgi:sec-independent protein translocase protein TatA